MHLEAQLLFEGCPARMLLPSASRHHHGSRQEEIRRLRAGPTLITCRDLPSPVRFVEVTSTVRDRHTTRSETRFFLTNLPPDKATPRRLLTLVRGHWTIENRLHYVRDFTFDGAVDVWGTGRFRGEQGLRGRTGTPAGERLSSCRCLAGVRHGS